MMMLRPVELAFARFQKTRDAKALAIVFDRTAKELLRVARHLAHEPSAAEDLVQATFLTAIESAESHERGRPVLPWLLGILGNHARATRRAARRQPDLQRLRGDVIADVHADVEARDVRTELAAAIARLPDAYRPVLRLWFEHGLEAHEIATVLERPPGTVRAQLSRGMESLRRLLPAGLAGSAAVTIAARNGLAAVRTKVLAHGVATPGLASSLAIGGLLVLNHKLIAAVAALVLVCVGWWVAAPPQLQPPGEGRGRESAVAATSGVAPTPRVAAPDEPVRATPPAAASTEPPPSPAPATTGSLTVRVRAAGSREPLHGVGVAVQPWQPAGLAASAAPSFRPTDEAGLVRFHGLAGGSWSIDVDRAGATGFAQVEPGAATERTIDVPDGLDVVGTVVDAAASPIGDATVVLHGSRLGAPVVAISDRLGRFHIERIVSGMELQARKPGHSPSLACLVQGKVGTRVELTLRLGAGGRRVSGRVREATGRVAANVAVAVLPAAARRVVAWERGTPQLRTLWLATDADGRFEADEVGAAEYTVVAFFTDPTVPPATAIADATTTDAHVELSGAAPTVVEGVVNVDGRPVEGVQVLVFTERSEVAIGYLQNLLLRCQVTDADGFFRVGGVLPGDVSIRAVRQHDVLAEARRPVAAGETVRVDLGTTGGEKLTVRVTTPGGLPRTLAGRLMVLVYDRSIASGAPSVLHLLPDGTGVYEGPRPGALDVVVATTPHAASIVQLARREEIAPGEREVRFELPAGELPVHHVRGRIVDGVRAPVSGVTVRAQRTDSPSLVVLVETTTAADGTFAIGPLPAGRYGLTTGSLTERTPVGDALLTADSDAHVGDLVLPSR